MKHLPLLLALLILPLISCSDDGNDSIDPPVYFSLLITNKTANNFNLYQSPTETGEGFSKTGFVLSNVNYRINQLKSGVAYTFRLVRESENLEDYDYEKTISSDGSEKTWTVY